MSTNIFKLIVPCHFGLEKVLKKEIIDLGYDIDSVEDGRITFIGDADAVARANIFLRTAERVLVQVGTFKAYSFDELFEGTKALEWDRFIPRNGRFWVAKASSVRSKLFSPSDIQSIMKKAMVDKLSQTYGITQFPEDGKSYPVRVFIKNDIVTVGLDTSGDSLHKRGYRKLTAKAPIAENLAAALLMLTPWKKDRILVDPFCGSGTFPIEAALMAAGIAPGMNRSFTAEDWTNFIEKKYWYNAVTEAQDMVDMSVKTEIFGYDIDLNMMKTSIENAKLAGVQDLIHFGCKPVKDLYNTGSHGFVVSNPPYGERLLEKEAMPALYKEFADAFYRLDNWSAYLITSYDGVEKAFGKKADKNRKIYNGMMKTYFYSFTGDKPVNTGRDISAADKKPDSEKRKPRKWTMS